MAYSLDFGWLSEASDRSLRGAVTTVLLIAVTTVLGTSLSILGAAAGAAAAVVRSAHRRLCRADPQHAVPGAAVLHLLRPAEPRHPARSIVAAILAMTINLAAYGTEIVGAGLDAVPHGQREAGMALGLRPGQVFIKIVLPQALKVIFPR